MTLQMSKSKLSTQRGMSLAADQDAYRYARCIEVSKRMRWSVEDVIKQEMHDLLVTDHADSNG